MNVRLYLSFDIQITLAFVSGVKKRYDFVIMNVTLCWTS